MLNVGRANLYCLEQYRTRQFLLSLGLKYFLWGAMESTRKRGKTGLYKKLIQEELFWLMEF